MPRHNDKNINKIRILCRSVNMTERFRCKIRIPLKCRKTTLQRDILLSGAADCRCRERAVLHQLQSVTAYGRLKLRHYYAGDAEIDRLRLAVRIFEPDADRFIYFAFLALRQELHFDFCALAGRDRFTVVRRPRASA